MWAAERRRGSGSPRPRMPVGSHRSTSSRRRFTPADPAVDCRRSSAVSSAHPRSLSADRVTTQSPRTNGAGVSSIGQVAGPALPGLGSRHLPQAVEYRPAQVGAARRTVAPSSGPRSPNRDLAPARRRLGQADRPNSAWTSSRGSWSAGVHHRHRPGSAAFRSAPDGWPLERRVVSADRVDRGSFTFNTSARSAVQGPASHAAQPSSGGPGPAIARLSAPAGQSAGTSLALAADIAATALPAWPTTGTEWLRRRTPIRAAREPPPVSTQFPSSPEPRAPHNYARRPLVGVGQRSRGSRRWERCGTSDPPVSPNRAEFAGQLASPRRTGAVSATPRRDTPPDSSTE
jgi:hypothetical protein